MRRDEYVHAMIQRGHRGQAVQILADSEEILGLAPWLAKVEPVAPITRERLAAELDETWSRHDSEEWLAVADRSIELLAPWADKAVCTYCGHVGPKTQEAMIEHMAGCKSAPYQTLFDGLAEVTRERDEARAEVERLRSVLADANNTVDRVWKALGISTYAEAGGKSIDELVAALKAAPPRVLGLPSVDQIAVILSQAYLDQCSVRPMQSWCNEMAARLHAALLAQSPPAPPALDVPPELRIKTT